MDGTSIAIWNRETVVVAISIGVWVIKVGFLMQGEPPSTSGYWDIL